jgi:protein TonB
MDFSITGVQFGIATLAIIVIVLGAILLVKRMVSVNSTKLADKYKGTKEGSSPTLKKYPEANIFGLSGTFLRLGLVCSIGLSILAFSWTTYEKKVNVDLGMLEIPEDIQMEQPRTAEPPPPPPPPPPPVIEAVPEEEVTEEVPEFKDQSVTDEIKNEPPPPPAPKPAPVEKPKPAPAPVKEVVEEIFTVVEQMPRFPGCEEAGGTEEEKKQCADKKMLEFIYKNIKYPNIARENGVEGVVVVRFVVEKDGSVSAAEVLRDIGAGCGEEALRVVQKMNELPQKWTPGKQRNENVRVHFNLPVRFKLE